MPRAIHGLAAIALTMVGCIGVIGGDASDEVSSSPAPASDPGTVTVHRLNNAEYNNTIRDLLGIDPRPAKDFPADDYSHGFDNISDALSMSPLQVELYRRTARKVAVEALTTAEAEPSPREGIVVCDLAEGEGCVREVVIAFGARAWRRPLTEREVTDVLALHSRVLELGAGAEEGLALVIEAFLSSPHFLFRFEIDPDPGSTASRPLDAYELASRLSYFIWSSMPDEALFEAAAEGRLQEPAEVRAQVERMLADDKASALADNFASQWLYLRGLEDHTVDETVAPGFDAELRGAMVQETRLFFDVFLFEDRPVTEMLTAGFTHLDDRLAAHYELEGASFERVSLDRTGRAGLLGQASILTVTSHPDRTSPVNRGKWVLEQMLCSEPPPPPPGVEGDIDGGAEGGSVREQLEQHRADPSCAACHQAMDPIGLSLEHFDAAGRWRERDGSHPIDASGVLPDGRRFDGAIELGRLLAEDPRFTRCLTEKMLTYALGRGLDHGDDVHLDELTQALESGHGSLAELITLVATSRPFLYRRGEPAP